MTENAKKPTAQNTIEDPPEYNPKNGKNPKEGSDWLGGPQNGDETPSEVAPSVTSHDVGGGPGGNVQGVDTQTGTQAKGMGSDGYTKHRFNETPGESDYTKHRFNETPSEAARNPQSGIQKPTEAAPSSSDSNPVTSTKSDETWSVREKG